VSNPYATPQAPVSDAPAKPDGPAGIGGWLILPVIGLFVFPVRVVISLVTDYVPIFQGGIWGNLTTPGSEVYHPLWAPVIIGEIFCNVGFLFFDLALIYLLFTKSHRFPKAFIVFTLANLAFIVGDAAIAWQIPAVAARGLEGVGAEIARTLVVAAVWVPYMLVSKRVRNTFRAPEAN
jgi:hypothetical protein